MPNTKRNLGFSHLRVGIFVLFGLAVLGFLILNSTGDLNPFKKELKLKARFSSADGLRPGAEVQLAGVTIGQVEEVKFLPPDSPEDAKVEAILTVDEELDGKPISDRIRTDSTAKLIATSVLSNDKIIDIKPGTSKGAPVKPNHVLDSTAAMSINQLTQTGNDLLEQMNKLSIPTNEILNKANQGEGTLGRFINDPSLYKSLDSSVGEAKLTMVKIQNLIDQAKSGDGTAGKLINDPTLYNNLNKTITQLDQISVDLRNGRGTAGKLLSDEALYNDTRAAVGDLRKSINKFNEIANDFKQITVDLNEGRGTAGKLLKDEKLYDDARQTLANFNSTAAKLDTLINNVQQGEGTIGKLFTDETLYNNINQTTSNINQLSSESTKLIYDFRQNPKKYLRIKLSIF